MLIIKYDPINGKVVPDALVKSWADDIIKIRTDTEIIVGSSLMIDATRVLIKKRKIRS